MRPQGAVPRYPRHSRSRPQPLPSLPWFPFPDTRKGQLSSGGSPGPRADTSHTGCALRTLPLRDSWVQWPAASRRTLPRVMVILLALPRPRPSPRPECWVPGVLRARPGSPSQLTPVLWGTPSLPPFTPSPRELRTGPPEAGVQETFEGAREVSLTLVFDEGSATVSGEQRLVWSGSSLDGTTQYRPFGARSAVTPGVGTEGAGTILQPSRFGQTGVVEFFYYDGAGRFPGLGPLVNIHCRKSSPDDLFTVGLGDLPPPPVPRTWAVESRLVHD